VLLQRRPITNSVFDSSKNEEQGADFVSDDSCQCHAPLRGLCDSSLASHDVQKIRHFSLHGLLTDRALELKSWVYPRKPRGRDPLPARSYKRKLHVVHAPVDDEDLQKFYQQPKFTLNDFIVQFSASEDVPVGVVEKWLYSPLTYGKLKKVVEDQCRPRNTQLSTQQLHLPDDLREVRHRVPHKQLLIEMTAVIREQLSKVIYLPPSSLW